MAIFFIAITLLYTAFFAKTLLLPIFVAAFLAMSTAPIARILQKALIPRAIAAAITVFTIIGVFVLLVISIAEPLQNWLEKIPSATETITEQLEEMAEPLDKLVGSETPMVLSTYESLISSASETLMKLIAQSTPALITQILATFVLTYFYLAYGNSILRSLVEIRHTFREKKITVEIVRAIQVEISYYLLIISIINCLLGLCVGTALWFLGIDDPILWGVLVTALNFAPYVGPFLMASILIFVGFIQFDEWLVALTPFTIYLFFNLLECQFVTPAALGSRLRLNPMIVLIWLFLWGWIWGAAGFLIGVPMLVCFKILAKRLDLFGEWIHLLDKNIQANEPLTLPRLNFSGKPYNKK